jgi:hypothetical protein
MSKEKYIEYAEKTFDGEAKELVLKQIELFYGDINVINTNKYKIGDDVKLFRGTFLHGIPNDISFFDWIVEKGL